MATLSLQLIKDLEALIPYLSVNHRIITERYLVFCRDMLGGTAFSDKKTYNSKKGCSVAIRDSSNIVSVYFFTDIFSSFQSQYRINLMDLGIVNLDGDLWKNKIKNLGTGSTYTHNNHSYYLLLKTKNPKLPSITSNINKGEEKYKVVSKPKKKKRFKESSYTYPIQTGYGETIFRSRRRLWTKSTRKR